MKSTKLLREETMVTSGSSLSTPLAPGKISGRSQQSQESPGRRQLLCPPAVEGAVEQEFSKGALVSSAAAELMLLTSPH